MLSPTQSRRRLKPSAARDGPSLSKSSALPASALASRPKIVVVDDDDDVGQSLQFVLETEGYAVEAYGNGRDLLRADLTAVACLIVDYQLPNMTGTALLDALGDRGVRPPFIVIAASPDQRCRDWAVRNQAELIEKPLLGGDLSAKVSKLLNPGAPLAG